MAKKKSKKKTKMDLSSFVSPTQRLKEEPMGEAEEIRAPAEHVVHPGDTVRKPSEEEVLAEAFAGAPLDRSEETMTQASERLITSITGLRNTRKKWLRLSHVQRCALLGALSALQEVTGQEKGGVPITLSRWLGIDPKTGVTVGV
jgi:hypothetical protein